MMSMDVNQSSAPFQDIRAYEPKMPSYKGGAGNVYIPQFRAAQGGTVNMASGGAFEDIQAYEGPMPNYIYQGRNIYTRAPVRQAPVTQRRPAPVVPVIAPPVQAPVVNPIIPQPVIETGGGEGIAPNPDFDTPEKQAAFYRDPENSRFAAITQFAQRYNPFASLQEYMDPGAKQRNEDILSGVYGLSPADRDYFTNNYTVSDFDIASAQASDDAANAAAQATGDYGSLSDFGGAPGAGVDGQDGDGSNPSGDGGNSSIGGFFASGGLMGLARGGMRSGGFVVPADVVAMIGEGNTDAGYKRIKAMVPSATAIKGKDGGQSDTVKTSIEGKQPARVAHGEMYIPPETVKSLGGAKKLYAMMDRVRQQATGSKKQIKPVNLKRVMA
jgi:hypothetical protein